MALWGLFKGKDESKKDKAFDDMNTFVNPMGEVDVARDCQKIRELSHGKIPKESLRLFTMGCKVLALTAKDYDDDDFVRSYIARSGNLLSANEARNIYVYFAGEVSHRNGFIQMMKAQGQPITQELLNQLSDFASARDNGTTEDQILGGHGDFGHALTNPIPTICVAGSKKYLAKLRYQNKPVENKRVGSTTSDVTEGSVDIYDIFSDGRKVASIYICPYHRKNSKLAPKGFSLSS